MFGCAHRGIEFLSSDDRWQNILLYNCGCHYGAFRSIIISVIKGCTNVINLRSTAGSFYCFSELKRLGKDYGGRGGEERGQD
jgi:hypothetical protein